jgi:hypothetical protein
MDKFSSLPTPVSNVNAQMSMFNTQLQSGHGVLAKSLSSGASSLSFLLPPFCSFFLPSIRFVARPCIRPLAYFEGPIIVAENIEGS